MNEFLLGFFKSELHLFDIQKGVMNDVRKYQVLDLVNQLINIPLKKYIQMLNSFSNVDKSIYPADIIQFSKFEDATVNLSKTLVLAGNSGFTWEEVGCYLLRKVESKNSKGANIKYGANHLKTGMILGLSSNEGSKWYLTKLGYVFNELTVEQQDKLLTRLSLKTKLVSAVVYDSMRKDVSVVKYINVLSESTQIRRRSNIKKLFSLLKDNVEYSVDYIFDSINGGGFV